MNKTNKKRAISSSNIFLLGLYIALISMQVACKQNNTSASYQGTPYEDEVYKSGAQKTPGKLQCEYYDIGGEGIAYHDNDSTNSGSGGLNKADGTYLHEFRKTDAVDISYTKFSTPPIDNSPYNFIDPEENDLYVGWTQPGEWLKYTIDVQQKGTYTLGIMYTANKDGRISLAVNDQLAADSILITSTYVAADTVGFRQWHHWNYLNNIATLDLEKGLQTFTIHTVEVGDMNYNYVDFKLLK
ncbi:MAG: carbohydrate-binding protein [Reichenbachiella sp.]